MFLNSKENVPKTKKKIIYLYSWFDLGIIDILQSYGITKQLGKQMNNVIF